MADELHDEAILLHSEVRRGNIEEAAVLLDRWPSLLSERVVDGTPLHTAVECANRTMLDFLLERGADIEALDAGGRTPLQLALLMERMDVARDLVRAGAFVDVFSAASLGLTDQLLELLQHHPALLHATDSCGDTPLHKAAIAGEVSAAQMLIKRGAALDARDTEGRTPLQQAVFYGRQEIVDLLLASGTELGIGEAATLGAADRVRALLDADPSLAAHIDPEGRTPLHRAAERGHFDIARLLIERGANVNAGFDPDRTPIRSPAAVRSRDHSLEYTPLHVAVTNNHLDVIRLLLEHGALLEARDRFGYTPLLLAAKHGHTAALTFLIDAGASVSDAAMNDFEWITQIATRRENRRPVPTPKNVDMVDRVPGNTALHFAAARGDVESVRLLLERGADKDAHNRTGTSPLNLAIWHGRLETAAVLLDNAVRPHGAQLAMSRGHPALVELLLRRGGRMNPSLFTVLAPAETLEEILELPRDTVEQARQKVAALPLRLQEQGRDLAYRSLLIAEALAGKNAGEQPVRHRLADPLHHPLLEQEPRSSDRSEIFAAVCDIKMDRLQAAIRQDPDAVKAVDIMLRTPLHWAVDAGPHEHLAVLSRSMAAGRASGSTELITEESERVGRAALEEERRELARLLLEHGARVDSEEATGETPLHKASRAGYLRLVELLIDHGAELNHRAGFYGSTPVHAAATGKSADAIKLLTERGADVTIRDHKGATALHSAASARNTEAVDFLLSLGVPVDARSHSGHSALHAAAAVGDKAVASRLLAAGASVNARDRKGRTPLFWAVEKGHLEMARLLLEAGADSGIRNSRGVSPVEVAVTKDHLGMVDLLRRCQEVGARGSAVRDRVERAVGNAIKAILRRDLGELAANLAEDPELVGPFAAGGTTPLHAAASSGNLEAAQQLIDQGSPPDPIDPEGRTPLELACRAGHTDLCDLLLRAGAAPDPFTAASMGLLEPLSKLIEENPGLLAARGEYGDTLLHIAAANGQHEAAAFLLAHGADADARGAWGWTPLLKAANAGDPRMVALLRSQGATVDLSTAAAIGDCEIAAALLRDGPDLVFLMDSFLRTPLFLAVRHGQLQAAQLLVQHGAEVDVRDSLGWTPLHQAVHSSQREAAAWLIEAGVPLHAQDRRGHTPLHLAAEAGRLELLELLLSRGADPNASDALPARTVSRPGDDEIDVRARLVLNPGSGAFESSGRTPLFLAVERGLVHVIEALLAAGADINARDRLGLTPLHVAAMYGNLEVARLLWEHGADTTIKGGFQQTAAELARERGRFNTTLGAKQSKEEKRRQELFTDIARLIRWPYHPEDDRRE